MRLMDLHQIDPELRSTLSKIKRQNVIMGPFLLVRPPSLVSEKDKIAQILLHVLINSRCPLSLCAGNKAG